MKTEKILIIGANGQLGSVLTIELQSKFGIPNVIATDIHFHKAPVGQWDILDVTNYDALYHIVNTYQITQLYHLAAILSAKGEASPLMTWNFNMQTVFNVLEVSRLCKVKKVFFPSSIAVYGEHTQRVNAMQYTNFTPTTVYGISKVAGENWVNYYHRKYNLDVRSLRFPGVLSYQTLPGGGTTDYAVDIFHKAIHHESFECFLNPDTTLPMIYIDDAIRATIELMDAPTNTISVRTSYNIAAMSFSPKQLGNAICKYYPQFKITYKPDFRQQIADSWPVSIDDTKAKDDWGWKPEYNLEQVTELMINNLK